jgi:protein-L-isoaspartate(D-aspartate) O-methyltransferase
MKEEELIALRQRMVKDQIVWRGVSEPRLLAVMEEVPRHRFVDVADLAWAYADGPLPIGAMQTMSQPYIVAFMTDQLQLGGTETVLEVGSGCGYQAAVLGRMAARVHTIELIPELAALARKNLALLGYDNVEVHVGDGSIGWADASPYDAILVAAAAPKVPQPLLDQLKDGGRLVVPVGAGGHQTLECWKRNGEKFESRECLEVSFVPLKGKFGWK